MKGPVGKKNVGKTLNSIHELTVQEMNKIEPEHWQAAIRLATKHEAFYAKHDKIELDPLLEPDLEDNENVEEPLEEEPVVQDVQDVKKCPHCSFETNLSRIYKQHTSSFRMCSICLKVFCGHYSSTNYNRHQKEHEKPKKDCDICGKSFQFPSKLKQHLTWSACGRQ